MPLRNLKLLSTHQNTAVPGFMDGSKVSVFIVENKIFIRKTIRKMIHNQWNHIAFWCKLRHKNTSQILKSHKSQQLIQLIVYLAGQLHHPKCKRIGKLIGNTASLCKCTHQISKNCCPPVPFKMA